LILGNEKILEFLKKKGLIENFKQANIQPAGVDLRIKCIYKLKSKASLGKRRKMPKVEKICEKGKFVLKPNEFVLVETMEKVNLPQNLAGIILPRSSLSRCGIALLTSFVDPGFKGTLTIGMKNLSEFPFEIEVGTSFAQLIFQEVKGCSKGYEGRYQGGKVV